MSHKKVKASSSTANYDDDMAFSTLSVDQLVDLQSNLQTRLASLAVPVPPPPPSKRRKTMNTAAAAAVSAKKTLVAKDDDTVAETAIHEASEAATATNEASTAAAVPEEEKERAETTTIISSSTATADDSTTPSPLVPLLEKTTDTHYDFLLKELQWLAADFAAERNRHASRRKQLAASLKQHVQTQEHRRLQQLAQAEASRRKVASKIAKELVQKQYWQKMNRLIGLEQKQSLEQSRAAAMNKQLVQLVQLTEQYTRALSTTTSTSSSRLNGGDDGQATVGRHHHHHHHSLTIEQALAKADQLSTRRSKLQVTDYARLQQEQSNMDDNDSYLYGESTASEDSDDDSYAPDEDELFLAKDDETTMLQAEQEERALQQQRRRRADDMDEDDGDDDSTTSFRADPVELQKLQEEANMPVELVLERLQSESRQQNDEIISGEVDGDDNVSLAMNGLQQSQPRRRRVRFDNDGSGVAIDGDNSDDALNVKMDIDTAKDDVDDEGSDEFVADETEVDDETTIAQEEALPKEMSSQEEINLLRQEGNMSIEELRRQYASILESRPDNGDDGSDGLGESEIDDEDEDSVAQPLSMAQLLHHEITDNTDDQDEFQLDIDEVDDETTMEAEESQGRDMSYEEELSLLRSEGEMSIEELRARYLNAGDAMDTDSESTNKQSMDSNEDVLAVNSATSNLLSLDGDDVEGHEEYQPDREELDDETTMEQEEKLIQDISYEDELLLLQQEGELSIEELRARYVDIDGDMDETSASSDDSSKTSAVDAEIDDTEGADAALLALEALSEQARQTLASRPFLLSPKVKLREYQQTGLNWLVSLQSRRLNGILADEMGLGKTLQTISLLGYLAAYKGIWGPHLVVVPTSVLLNWETELKRFCPGLKVLCYYGAAKRRKELRQGWTKSNSFHVVLTSYQLAVQDAFAFKRKKWYYLILDEAQNIKNFQSQRWQTLINFNTQRRLLLTGTPLQGSLMELWSLLHFLMPYVFRSRKEFSYWFANPMSGIVEGTRSHNDDVINRLHGIIRPFVLRRLKKDVESQMPGKYEHIVKCQLSRRQMFIYEEYMARSSTRQSLGKRGNFMDMMNVLMQLRKVCNHPDLFEPRPVVTPFVMDSIVLSMPSQILDMLNPFADDTVSECLVSPIWSGSCGLPSVSVALRHDALEHDALKALHETSFQLMSNGRSTTQIVETAAALSYDLSLLWLELENQKRQEESDKLDGFIRLNISRCTRAPFPYPSRLLRRLTLHTGGDMHDILSTPTSLMAMRRSQRERASDVDQLVKRFVFCVPKASARSPAWETSPRSAKSRKMLDEVLLKPLEEAVSPFEEADARLSSCFPDKKLVQFDAGKLQILAELLRELKRGGHRVLIFTQMSKMLDILEAFLNLYGYTYMRLDGSTSVDRRQRLMDRFNSDDKIFCFILSTRSGGVGINLVGADTVIFYDSDWNPAIDAQAQDRAHRIGQTREVHIYRLITQHTIEENILSKAQQKRKLDMLVMDRGQFDSSQLLGHGENAKTTVEQADAGKLYTASGLRDILGATDDERASETTWEAKESEMVSKEQVEKAMTTLEDDEDVVALRGAQKEAAEELREFDESIEIRNRSGSDDEDDDNDKQARPATTSTEPITEEDADDQKKSEEELEKEFEAWQDKVGVDFAALAASLRPAERYGLRFRQEVDPYYSVFAITEYNQKIDAANESVEAIDYAAIELEKAKEEQLAFENGDLLGTFPQPDGLIRQRSLYQREKSRLRASKLRRKLTGEAWELRNDAASALPFWYNIDTGEALWDKPIVLDELEAFELATEKRFEAMPRKPLLSIMEFLLPYPDRTSCARVSKRWQSAASCPSFVKHVYPVELGAYTRDESKFEHNHFRTISDALAKALPGDTVELGDGHYWINDEHLNVQVPIRIIGDEHDPSNVVVEVVSGTIHWNAARGYCEGVTFRRPQMPTGDKLSSDLVRIENKGMIDVIASVFDNGGSSGQTIVATGRGMKGVWRNVVISGGTVGLLLSGGSGFGLIGSVVRNQTSDGVVCDGRSKIVMTNCKVQRLGGVGVKALQGSRAKLNNCSSKEIGGEVCFQDAESSVEFT